MPGEKHEINPHDAPRIREWLQSRGGLYIWRSVNLSNPGMSWTTPALKEDGTPVGRPTWEADSAPERHITDPADVVVVIPKIVKRMHVAVRMGAQGMSLKLTDASTRKLRAAKEKAGPNAWHEFDYNTQEAIVYVPEKIIPLTEYQEEV